MFINLAHSSMISLGKMAKRVFIHVSLLLVAMAMVLYIVIILSFKKALSTFLVIILALGVLTLLLNWILLYFKGWHTIKNLLVAPKDQDPILKKSGVIYRFNCGRVDCNEEYIGESSRVYGERFKEHQKAPSPIYDHSNITGHQITIENFNIVGREDQNLSRAIKEALYIRVNNPSPIEI